MEEEKTNKKCFRCGNFRCYYTKGLYRFSKTSQGYCLEKKEIVDKHGTCSNWNSNYKKFYSSKKQAVKVLRELLLEIAAIRQVLQSEEEQDEDYKK